MLSGDFDDVHVYVSGVLNDVPVYISGRVFMMSVSRLPRQAANCREAPSAVREVCRAGLVPAAMQPRARQGGWGLVAERVGVRGVTLVK